MNVLTTTLKNQWKFSYFVKYLNVVQTILKLFFLSNFKKKDKPNWKKVFFSFVIVIACSIPIADYPFNPVIKKFPDDSHGLTSIDMAINNVMCKKYSMLSQKYSLKKFMTDNENSMQIPISTLPALLAGSVENYCGSLIPSINSENSLMLIESTLIYCNPTMTLKTLGKSLIFLRITILTLFILILLRFGMSILSGIFLFVLGLDIQGCLNQTFFASLYPFLMIAIIFFALIQSLFLELKLHRSLLGGFITHTLIGFIGGLFFNVRSSYFPFLVFSFLLYIWFSVRDLKRVKNLSTFKMITLGLLFLFCIGMGFNTFQKYFFRPIVEIKTDNRAHHVVGHPLVLGLSIPQNELCNREKIFWDDGVGEKLALKFDPNATYLGPLYEKALLAYYVKLWIYYPKEMLNIYWGKLKFSGEGLATFVSVQRNSFEHNIGFLKKKIITMVDYSLHSFSNGVFYFCVFLFCMGFFIFKWKDWNIGIVFLGALLSLGAALLLLEATIIMPMFILQYHNALLFIIFFLIINFYQMILNIVYGSLEKIIHVIMGLWRKQLNLMWIGRQAV